jgi:hypothetical protein
MNWCRGIAIGGNSWSSDSPGIGVTAIADGELYGHHYFSMHDPDGNGISFYTSHCSDKPV